MAQRKAPPHIGASLLSNKDSKCAGNNKRPFANNINDAGVILAEDSDSSGHDNNVNLSQHQLKRARTNIAQLDFFKGGKDSSESKKFVSFAISPVIGEEEDEEKNYFGQSNSTGEQNAEQNANLLTNADDPVDDGLLGSQTAFVFSDSNSAPSSNRHSAHSFGTVQDYSAEKSANKADQGRNAKSSSTEVNHAESMKQLSLIVSLS